MKKKKIVYNFLKFSRVKNKKNSEDEKSFY